MKIATEPFDTLFSSTAEWADHLVQDHFYPPSHLKQHVDALGVYWDAGHRRPLMLVRASHDEPDKPWINEAQRDGFGIVVTGSPQQPHILKLGLFDSDAATLERVPSWMPRHPRRSLVARSVLLLPYESEHSLRRAFASCHDVVYKALANDPAAAFDLLLLVIAAKVRDEQQEGGQYEFATVVGESIERQTSRLNRLIVEANAWLNEDVGSLGDVPPVRVALAKRLLREFENYSLTLTALTAGGTDVLGTAYEAIVGATFRGELGSYFTPRTIADFVAQMTGVQEGRVLDPACGSAGLLLAARRSVGDHADALELYGNDLNPRMVRAARLNFLLHGLDPSHVLQGDGLQLDRVMRDTIGVAVGTGVWLDAIRDGPFDAVLANPPFAGFESDGENLQRTQTARRRDGSIRSLNRALPFIEAIVASLRVGGVAGLVLPTSVLNAEEESFVRLRELLLERIEVLAIVGLPEKAFVHTDCGIHGALLFVKRVRRPRTAYDFFVAWARHLGYDRLGRYRRENDLPEILERYRAESWPEENRFPIDVLMRDSRWDPAWLHVVRTLPASTGLEVGDHVALTDLLKVRDARISRRDIRDDGTLRYFEVGDADLETGQILRIHEASGFELRKKGRIRNRVRAGDVLLPNHRDSLIAKGNPTGRSAVIVTDAEDGVLTTNRFLVLTPQIDRRLLRRLLNTAGIRRQIVAQCRGAASLDIREKTLAGVLVPRALVESSVPDEVIAMDQELEELRRRFEEREAKLAALIESTFGTSGEDFRPAGWGQL